MPKYTSYAKQGSFSDFQLKIPDESSKILSAADRQLKGMRAAEQTRKENEAIYLDAQKLVQSQEEMSRQRNFELETKERDSYRKFLQRDYDNRIKNLENESISRQKNLEAVRGFSKTAANIISEQIERRDQAKRSAAMDVISRAGLTYKDALALQKIDDNLTFQEFSAHDWVGKRFGPDANPTQLDAAFKFFQNRNSKIYFENTELFQNTVNKFPQFIEQAILKLEGQPPKDVEAFLQRQKRDFLDLNFSTQNVRPEVLHGMGVFKNINATLNQYRQSLHNANRSVQLEQIRSDRVRALTVTYRKTGEVGLREAMSVAPSREQRSALLDMIEEHVSNPGSGLMSYEAAKKYLNSPGSGSNGQSFLQAFEGTPEYFRALQILNKGKRAATDAVNAEEANTQTLVDKTAQEMLNNAMEGGLTLNEKRKLQLDIPNIRPGYTSTRVLNSLQSLTDNRALILQSEANITLAAKANMLTPEFVLQQSFGNLQDLQSALSLAERLQKINTDSSVTDTLEDLRDFIESPRFVAENLKDGSNATNVDQTFHKYRSIFLSRVQELQAANPDESINKLAQLAYAEVIKDWDKKEPIDKRGRYSNRDNERKSLDPDGALARSATQLNTSILRIASSKGTTRQQRYKRYAELIDIDLISKTLDQVITQDYVTLPAIYRTIQEKEGVTGFEIISGLATATGNQELIGKVETITKSILPSVVPATQQPIRSRYKTPERVGRANVQLMRSGDKAPIRLPIIQYVSGDPSIADTDPNDRRIVFDPRGGPTGHGKENYHHHYEFKNRTDALKAKIIFDNDPRCRVTSYLRLENPNSAHYYGVALDVAPDPSLPKHKEAEWSAYCNSLIGFDPNE